MVVCTNLAVSCKFHASRILFGQNKGAIVSNVWMIAKAYECIFKMLGGGFKLAVNKTPIIPVGFCLDDNLW